MKFNKLALTTPTIILALLFSLQTTPLTAAGHVRKPIGGGDEKEEHGLDKQAEEDEKIDYDKIHISQKEIIDFIKEMKKQLESETISRSFPVSHAGKLKYYMDCPDFEKISGVRRSWFVKMIKVLGEMEKCANKGGVIGKQNVNGMRKKLEAEKVKLLAIIAKPEKVDSR